MIRIRRLFLPILAIAGCLSASLLADQPLLLIGKPPVEAFFLASQGDGTLAFRWADETHLVPRHELVRWSTPNDNLDRPVAVLVDGSQLVLAESWSGQRTLHVGAESSIVLTDHLGEVDFPRAKLRAVLLKAPADSLRRRQLLARLLSRQAEYDRLLLANGDELTGKLLEIDTQSAAIEFQLAGNNQPTTVVSDRVAGFALAFAAQPAPRGELAVGMRDGSYLVAKSFDTVPESVRIELACGIRLAGQGPHDIVHLQSFGPQLRYLSELDPAEYRHEPFLNVPWPYRRNLNVFGGPLLVDKRHYRQGLAMHSASWLTYDLARPDEAAGEQASNSRLRRFAAQLAIDDAADGWGSVVFRVLLRQADSLQEAYVSPVVRGGDLPLPISVELGDADQLLLAVEYADRGDQRDYANWLDARLE